MCYLFYLSSEDVDSLRSLGDDLLEARFRLVVDRCVPGRRFRLEQQGAPLSEDEAVYQVVFFELRKRGLRELTWPCYPTQFEQPEQGDLFCNP